MYNLKSTTVILRSFGSPLDQMICVGLKSRTSNCFPNTGYFYIPVIIYLALVLLGLCLDLRPRLSVQPDTPLSTTSFWCLKKSQRKHFITTLSCIWCLSRKYYNYYNIILCVVHITTHTLHKHKMLIQCWFNAGTLSTTLVQQ